METTVKERLISFISYLGIGQGKFEKECGMSNGYVNNIRKSITSDKLQKIALRYPELNKGWLMTGEGSMLKGERGNKVQPQNQTADFRLVPMYNIDARGGFADNDEVDVSEYVVDHIPFKDAKENDICMPVSGNSMAPTYCAGSIVLLHRVERWAEFLELGQVYMIVLKDGRRLIKELRASQEDCKTKYLCVSHNPAYDPVELPKDMISLVFLVRAVYAKTAM